MNHKRTVLSASAAFLVTTLVLVGAQFASQHPNDTGRTVVGPITAEALDLLPSSTPRDWAIYGDHLVVVHVITDTELPPSAGDLKAGEGLISRQVTFAVDQVEWSRPGAPSLPPTLTWQELGWTFHGDRRTAITMSGSPRLVAGHSYLLPVTYFAASDLTGTAGWGPLASDVTLPYDKGTIDNGPPVVGTKAGNFTNGFSGLTAKDVANELATVTLSSREARLERRSVFARLKENGSSG